MNKDEPPPPTLPIPPPPSYTHLYYCLFRKLVVAVRPPYVCFDKKDCKAGEDTITSKSTHIFRPAFALL